MESLGPRQRILVIVCAAALLSLSGWAGPVRLLKYFRDREKAPQVDEILKPFYTEEELRKDLFSALAMIATVPVALGLGLGAWRRRGFAYHHSISYWLLGSGVIGILKGVGHGTTWWVVVCGIAILICGGEWIACLRLHSHFPKPPESPPAPASLP